MNIKATKALYRKMQTQNLCHCAYCQNYILTVKSAYPLLSEYLSHLGIDIEMPFETLPLEPDAAGYITYVGAQYIVCGKPDDFMETAVDSVNIAITESHPSTAMDAPHFVIELSPIRLKWVV